MVSLMSGNTGNLSVFLVPLNGCTTFHTKSSDPVFCCKSKQTGILNAEAAATTSA